MSRIKILPDVLSNKIAAGEVVERPASVVKELLENALDAGSSRIVVEIDQGGKSLIRVSDDGIGMGHDDALLALERYATSKIYTDRDLFDIRTLGFRGEALPSIAAVSRFSLITREKKAEAGTQIDVAGGKIMAVAEIGAPAGTVVSVNRLFYNVPARRKFLKTVNTEMGHVGDTLSAIALGWPSVRFRLAHNGRRIRDWPPAPDPADRVADVLGASVRPHLLQLASETEAVDVTGWLAAPAVSRSTTGGIHVFVNGRFVKDRILRHALLEGYAGRMMKGRFPVAVLFLRLPFDRVDVNVHPTKHEVRFADAKKVHDAVAAAVSAALAGQDRPAWPGAEVAHRPAAGLTAPQSRESAQSRERAVFDTPAHGETVAESPAPFAAPTAAGSPPPAQKNQQPLWQPRRFADARIIGQYLGTYLLCETDSGLMVLDQHAAHERILYEQFKRRTAASSVVAQKLLMPETVELGYREADALTGLIGELAPMGFEIEPFGGNSFVVKAVPAMLSGRQIAPLIVEIAETAATVGFGTEMGRCLDEYLALMACHGAIRAGQALSDRQVRRLLEDLDRCDNPSHCPHGRPTWIRWTPAELEKAFGRTG